MWLQDTGEPLNFVMWHALMERVQPGCSHSRAKVLFDCVDADKKGHISVKEFLQVTTSLQM